MYINLIKKFFAMMSAVIIICSLNFCEASKKVIDEFNLRGLVVTRSAKGLTLIDGEKISHIKARAQEVFDVSGAGDTVIAVFALALAGNLDSEVAAYLANVAAGVVVAKVGTYALNHEELLNAL